MKKLVIIGANDFQDQLIIKAKELGYETHVFAWKDGAVGEKHADYFYPISITEKDKILEKCKEIKPDGICSIGSDLASITVNYVAEKLNLPGNPIKITEQCTNKFAMRKKLLEAGIKVPKFLKTHAGEKIDVSDFVFPLIVKPTDRSGSRGITKINNESEIKNAVEYATKDAFEKCAIIEEFIDGEEYSAEGITQNGKHKILAFTKKYTTGAPNFIETGHKQPSNIPEDQIENIKKEITKALDALEIKNGASHAEFKINKKDEVRIIEIGARMGGDCIGSDLVELSTGYDYMKMVIDVACGNEIDFTKKESYDFVGIRFIFDENDLDVMRKFEKENPEKIHRISEMEIENLGKTVDSSSRIGYYIIKENKHEN